MTIPVFYSVTESGWMYHLAGENEHPICGAELQPGDWEQGAVAFIIDYTLCPECVALRQSIPSLWNPPEAQVLRCVYLFRFLGSSYYKIGIAKDVSKRLASLQHSCPVPLLLVWYSKYCDSDIARFAERYVHDMYRHQRVKQQYQREWFRLSRDDVKRVQETVKEIIDTESGAVC